MIDPKCLSGDQGFGHDASGYLLPCCWCANEIGFPQLKEITKEKFKISNANSIEEIVNSEEWVEFYRVLREEPEKAPSICKNFCRSNYAVKKTY